MIFDPTQAALAASKARDGTPEATCNGPRPTAEASAKGREHARRSLRAKAEAACAEGTPMLVERRCEGLSLRAVADVINVERRQHGGARRGGRFRCRTCWSGLGADLPACWQRTALSFMGGRDCVPSEGPGRSLADHRECRSLASHGSPTAFRVPPNPVVVPSTAKSPCPAGSALCPE